MPAAEKTPSRRWVALLRARLVLAAALLAGLFVGVGGYTFMYARGGAYLTNDPAACANCHVMREQFEGWRRGSHHAVATCNDCHAPRGLVPKLAIKALNGFRHSWAFTTGRFHEPIASTPLNQRVTEGACRGCHGAVVDAIETHRAGPVPRGDERVSCIRCHRSVGHLH
ncbi:MAG: cytochrome c nitrite reductase small subunit [Deltaproteobacteria bacterium]|jgi:cytochrome c nitrite reductase small subunit|nr:cytochrome c nitrite reductase small subunit [Deltaproteobacteria bacterium]